MPAILSVTVGAALILAATGVAAAVIFRAARSIETFRHDDHEAFTSASQTSKNGGGK
jgi:hypothetical protein